MKRCHWVGAQAKKPKAQEPNAESSVDVYKVEDLHSPTQLKKLVPKHPRADGFVATGLYAVNSFKELEAKISALESKDERGAAFEIFAEAFFVTQQGIDPSCYWPQSKLPPLLQEELGLPRKDYGIDSVYRNDLQEYDACQCKFRTNRPTLTWEDVSTFSALASSGKFQNKVLFTNCETVVPILQQDPYSVILVRGSRLDQLTPDQLRVINEWLNKQPISPVKKQPRPDQIEAIEAINAELAVADRAQAIQFCGTGKSLVSLWLKESRNPDTTIVFVPSLALLSQIRSDWMIDRNKKFLPLCVGSDLYVDDEEGDRLSAADLDFRLTTSSEEVRRFLDLQTDLPKVVFCTYQSTHVVAATGHVWDLGLFDEAHKTAGRQGRSFSEALDENKVSIKKRVALTATPRHCNPLKKDKEGEAEVLYSMDDEKQYGKVAYNLSCRKAVEMGIICDYKVLITVFTTTEINEWLYKNAQVLVKPDGEGSSDYVKACEVANQLAIAKAYAEYGIRKTFTFHSRVKHAREFASDGVHGIQSHLKDVECRSIDGSMNMGERRAIMEIIKDAPRALLANSKCLTEGVNLPCVDCVAFLSPKRSRIDVAQAMGRGMRKNGGSKKTGYVIVPVYVALAEGENYEEAIKRAKFDTVLEVLQTLKEVDEAFMDFLKELAQPKKLAKGSSDWKLNEHIEFIAPTVLLEQLADSITLEFIDRLIPSWDKRIAELIAYKEAHGNCDVPKEDASREICSLGVWCATVRGKRRLGSLSPDRIAQLTVMGFCWEPHAALWEKRYAELVAYKEIHGHCNVLQNSGPLGSWCSNQRAGRKGGELSSEQITKLDALGFWWNTIDAQWDKMFAELVAYKEVHGHCNVPQGTSSLGAWCTTQRVRRNQGKLSPERIAQLDTLGFCWNDHIIAWDKKIAELIAYKQANGNCNAPTGTSPLGRWCDQQRQRRRKGRLSPERIAQLDALDFCWHVMNTAWGKRYAELVAYKEIHGHCNTQRVGPTKDLDCWCWKQRARYKRDTLGSEEIAQLNALGFCWDFTKTVWDERLSELVAYKEIHGHCNVSRSHAVLERWCTSQRQRRKKGKISPEQIAQLDALGFRWNGSWDGPWKSAYVIAWDKQFAELVAFKKVHGHCNVSGLSGSLGNWCQTQRQRRKQGKLNPEQIAQLDALGFCWQFRSRTVDPAPVAAPVSVESA